MALDTAARALLHFAMAAGLGPWTNLLFLGPAGPLGRRLASLSSPSPAGNTYHFAVAPDARMWLADQQGALADIYARLLPGGHFIFGLNPSHTAPDLTPWKALDDLRHAGFSDYAAYLYGSEELGYPGRQNILFKAIR
ncbi:MAG: hypothetical protein POH28_13730 [Acidocella sp.]|nr:hypothetical protein [Acidocella sp.]